MAAILSSTILLFLAATQIASQEILPEVPNEKFDANLYQIALNVTTNSWKSLTTTEVENFTKFSSRLEAALKEKMIKVTKINVTMDEYFSIVPEMLKNGEITSAEISQLKSHTLAMQQAYTKRVIEIFDLTPERLGVTQDYLCDVFERCPASTTKSQISEQNEIVTEESVQETSTEATNEDEIVVEEETTIKPSIEETSTIVQETTSNVQESTSNFQETTIVTEEAVKETTTEKEVSTAQAADKRMDESQTEIENDESTTETGSQENSEDRKGQSLDEPEIAESVDPEAEAEESADAEKAGKGSGKTTSFSIFLVLLALLFTC